MVLPASYGHTCHLRTVLMMPNAYCLGNSKGWFHKHAVTPRSLQVYVLLPDFSKAIYSQEKFQKSHNNKDEELKSWHGCFIQWSLHSLTLKLTWRLPRKSVSIFLYAAPVTAASNNADNNVFLHELFELHRLPSVKFLCDITTTGQWMR